MRKIITAFMLLLCAVCGASAANYLTFTAEEDSSTFGIDYYYLSPDVQYSLDGGASWAELTVRDTILLAKKGDKALIRGYNENGLGSNGKQFVHFVMTGAIAASGSVMSLIDGVGVSKEIPNGLCFNSLFGDCASLMQAPELPATTLTDYCYYGMFSGCTSLTQAPALPATTLAESCYSFMFKGCTSLTKAPALPVSTLAIGCYLRMFKGCTSLTQAPELPATNLAPSCYYEMFFGCTNLIETPKLPATTLAVRCYEGMFGSCTSLTQAPELPATTLADDCYAGMFESCTSLTQAPELPATTLAENCYNGIFARCTSLSQIRVSFDEWSDDFTGEWTEYVAPTGTFICPKDLPLEYGWARIPEGWTVKYIDDTVAVEANYLTFAAEEDSSTFRIINERGNNPNVQYSLDGGVTWTALAAGDIITLAHKGDRALLKGKNLEGFSNGSSKYSSFTMTGKIAASGSVMSLIDGAGVSTTIPNTYCFNNLFAGCTSLTQAPELPATKLDGYCYASMFSGCTGLTQAPELPATKLVWYCYNSMFKGCTSLTKAPKLSVAEIEGKYCYGEMFYGCTNMSQIDVAFEEWPINDGTYNWVKNVAPTGLFICSKTLPLECGVNRIPEGWTLKFIDDITPDSANYLTFTAEEDSSTFGIVDNYKNFDVLYSLDGGETWNALTEEYSVTLAHKGDKALIRGYNPNGFNFVSRCRKFTMTRKIAANGSVMSLIDGVGNTTVIPSGYCFFRLFYRCSSLTQAPELPATTLAESCYGGMFLGCANLTKAPELPAITLAESCYASMFSGCANLTQAPELPATTLAEYCYEGMFSECTNLKEASELPATTLAEACYEGMFSGCTNLTQAPELPATTLAEWCYSYMFNGCTNLTQAPKLPAITLNYRCYDEMFDGCTNLTQAPELPATTLAEQCYSLMFYGCTSLSQIHVSFDNWSDANYPTSNWVKDVAPTGTFICPKALAEEYGESRIPEGWTVKYIDDTVAVAANYLTFTAEEDGSTFGIINEGGNNPDVQYSLDGGETWTALAAGDTITLAHKGDKALLRGDNPEGFSKDYEISSSFTMTGKIAASGSVMSLIDNTGETLVVPAAACFCKLFYGCASLTQAPELPATTLADFCYESMFRGCTSLTQAPELPATTLSDGCYAGMFQDCTSLTQAPELPATSLSNYCYNLMFRGCTSLTQAPELPATTLASSCYEFMFSGCTNLSEISVVFDEWSGYTQYWVYNVAPTGTFICPKGLPLEYGENRIPEGWTVKYIEDTVAAETNYLTFTAEEDGSTFGIVNKDNNPDVQYSLDGGKTWTALAAGDTIMLAHKGDKALLRGDNPEGFSKGYDKYSSFTMTGKIAASGSVMSLIDGMGKTLVVPAGYCFYALFKGCTSLTQAPELPATTLAEYCYLYMFNGCTSLTQAPELPATTLSDGCYAEMFYGCTSLTQAPELPATKLARGCYSHMFSGCTSLTQAPELPATTLVNYCYYEMFSGCTSLTQAPELPATTLAIFCYEYMFSGCTSLTKAPELLATELPDSLFMRSGCCESMFSGCTNLSEISVAFDKWNDNTFEWVKDVAPTGTFICPKALALEYGEDRIPEGWTVKYVEEGSGVSSTLSDDITVWTDDLTIFVRGAEGEVSLYDMSGRIVATSNSKDEERALCVPSKGVYVVRTNNGTSDVLVR